MHFDGSSSVTLLFEFWTVHGPGEMVISVIVVLLLTVLYEFLRVWIISLEKQAEPLPTPPFLAAVYRILPCLSTELDHPDRSMLSNSQSELSMGPMENISSPVLHSQTKKRWLLHSLQTCLHVIQVVLGYALMLCVMSYNVWIFLGVIMGALLGYFLAFPFLDRYVK